MSTPKPTYKQVMLQAAKKNPAPKPTPSGRLVECENSVYDGALMTVGILGSTFVVRKVSKGLAPPLSAKSAVSLGTVVILTELVKDYAINSG